MRLSELSDGDRVVDADGVEWVAVAGEWRATRLAAIPCTSGRVLPAWGAAVVGRGEDVEDE